MIQSSVSDTVTLARVRTTAVKILFELKRKVLRLDLKMELQTQKLLKFKLK